MSIHATLTQAAHRITTTGLHKGGYYKGWRESDGPEGTTVGDILRSNEDLPCCTAGAILYASNTPGDAMDAQEALAKFLGLPSVRGIPDWSDEPDRTPAEVVAALLGAAEVTA